MCFSLAWLQQLCVWLIVLAAVVALIRLLVPWLVGLIGIPIVGQALNIVLWAVVAIMAVYVVFALIGCLLGMGGSLAPFPLRH